MSNKTIKPHFLDTHKHFRPVIEILRKCPITWGGTTYKNKTCLDSQPMDNVFETFIPKTNVQNPWKNNGYRVHNSELRLHLDCALNTRCVFTHGTQNLFIIIDCCKYVLEATHINPCDAWSDFSDYICNAFFGHREILEPRWLRPMHATKLTTAPLSPNHMK